MRKVLESKLAGMPKEQREQLIEVVTQNPDFFAKIAEEIKQKTKNGVSESAAAMEVMIKHKHELQKLMQK